MRERMRKLKDFIKANKRVSKSNEEFFEEHKKYFAEYNVKNYTELEKLIKNYDKENPEEVDKEKYKKNLKVEHIKDNDLIIKSEKKAFNNLNMILSSGISNNNIYIKNTNNYFINLKTCKKERECSYNSNKKEYINNKIKSYEIKTVNNEEFIGIKKIKYNNESELIKESNICCINYKLISKNIICPEGNITENGISSDEFKKRKIKKFLQNLSVQNKQKYEKVKKIIDEINNKIKNVSFLDNIFCIKCNKWFKKEYEESHFTHSTLQIENYNKEFDSEINNINYNSSLNKIYDNLKKDQKKLLKSRNHKLIIYYEKLLFSLYEIIINNNSIEELISSIIIINDYLKEIELKTFIQFFKDYFSFYIYNISKITYLKVKKIEKFMADLEDENNNLDIIIYNDKYNNNNHINKEKVNKLEDSKDNCNIIAPDKMSKNIENININFNKFDEEEKKKYFLQLGYDIKFKYNNTQSIIELYYKAKEQNINPINYDEFIVRELNSSNH